MNLKRLHLFLYFLLVSTSVFALENMVVIATLTDFPPNCFKKAGAVEKIEEILPPGTDSSQLQGFSWDVVRESYHERGYTIRLFVAPWSRGLHHLKTGKVQLIFPAVKTKEREKEFYYSRESVDQTNILIYIKTENSHLLNNFKWLAGKRIATVRGWSYGKKWEAIRHVRKDPASTLMQGFYMLDSDRVFGVIGYEDSFDYRLKKELVFHKYKKSLVIEPVADYLIGRKTATARKQISEFDKGKKILMQNGTMKRIYTKWASSGIIMPVIKNKGDNE